MHRPGTPSNPSRRLPNSSPAHDGPAYQTALRGASLAFQRTGPSPGPNNSANSPRNNGSLIATTRISRQTTGNSAQDGSHGSPIDHGLVAQRLAQVQAGPYQSPQNTNNSFLKPPGRPNISTDPRATSFIAATLAASRSASPSPSQLPQIHPYPQQSVKRVRRKNSAASSVTSLDLATDTSPIPSTNALISMFEKNKNASGNSRDMDPVKKDVNLHPLTPSKLSSPARKPEASPSRMANTMAWEQSPRASISEPKEEAPIQAHTTTLRSKKRPPTPPMTKSMQLETKSVEKPPMAKIKPRATTPPRPINRSDTDILSPQPRRAASHKMVRPQASPEKEPSATRQKPPPPAVKPKLRPQSMHETSRNHIAPEEKSKPPSPPPRRSPSASSNESFVSASSVQTPQPDSSRRGRSVATAPHFAPEPPRRSRPNSVHSTAPVDIPKRRNPVPPPPRRSQHSSNTDLNSLTAATMAGILASSRAPASSVTSSPRPPSAPPPRKTTPHIRQTLRKPTSNSDDEESKWKARHRTKPLQSKKKHTHHEGARRRWREEITPRERKRYEGVWASNRGYLLNYCSLETIDISNQMNGTTPPRTTSSPLGNDGDLVVNIAVRDIWSRSRLPVDELAEVWDLVDRSGRGMLDKTEFVVGMWLIDQRLRGRKIPQKVTDSVWASARGISIKGPPKPKEKKKVNKHKH